MFGIDSFRSLILLQKIDTQSISLIRKKVDDVLLYGWPKALQEYLNWRKAARLKIYSEIIFDFSSVYIEEKKLSSPSAKKVLTSSGEQGLHYEFLGSSFKTILTDHIQTSNLC